MSGICRIISGGALLGELARGPQRLGAASLHAGRLPDEVDVVGVVEAAVDRARLRRLEVRAVSLHGGDVDADGVGVAADAPVDVRGHVDDVAGARHQPGQPVGGRLGARRAAGWPRRRGCRGAGRPDGSGSSRSTRSSVCTISVGARLRRAVGRPQVPRPQVHHGVGEERGGLEIVGELPGHLAHGVGVGAVERLALGGGIRRRDGGRAPRSAPARPGRRRRPAGARPASAATARFSRSASVGWL